jgi:hypothetical protein
MQYFPYIFEYIITRKVSLENGDYSLSEVHCVVDWYIYIYTNLHLKQYICQSANCRIAGDCNLYTVKSPFKVSLGNSGFEHGTEENLK